MSQLGTVYATKRRRRNGKSLKPPPKDGVTKSNPSKRHRERLNAELDLLASLLPFEQNILSKLDRLSILRLAVSYLRTKSYFQVMHKEKEENGMLTHSHHHDSYRSSRELGAFEHSSLDGDMILQALNGFLMILTCEGEVFFATHSIESYLGFHQSDIVHQSVYELVHSEDREELQRQLLWNSFLPADLAALPLSEALAPDKINYLERSFTVRFRCLLDNTSGFLRLDIRGRVKILHGQNRKTEDPPLALFAYCTPFGPPSLLEIPQKENMFKSKHKLDFSLVSMDQRGKFVLGYSDGELASMGGYDLVHYDDLSYVASAHQELLKTGASGMIAYRYQKKDTEWQWLQTSSRLVYKNSKPDFVICTHRQLMEEEGRDLLGKRTMDFKVSYLDTGLASTYFSEADQLIIPPSNSPITSSTSITSSTGGGNGTVPASVTPQRTTRRYKTQLRDFLSTCRSKRKLQQQTNVTGPSITPPSATVVEYIPDPTAAAAVAAAYSNLNPMYSSSPYGSSADNIYMTPSVHSTNFYPVTDNLFHQYRLQGAVTGYYPEYHPHPHHPHSHHSHHHHPHSTTSAPSASSATYVNGFLPYDGYTSGISATTKVGEDGKWQHDNGKYYSSHVLQHERNHYGSGYDSSPTSIIGGGHNIIQSTSLKTPKPSPPPIMDVVSCSSDGPSPANSVSSITPNNNNPKINNVGSNNSNNNVPNQNNTTNSNENTNHCGLIVTPKIEHSPPVEHYERQTVLMWGSTPITTTSPTLSTTTSSTSSTNNSLVNIGNNLSTASASSSTSSISSLSSAVASSSSASASVSINRRSPSITPTGGTNGIYINDNNNSISSHHIQKLTNHMVMSPPADDIEEQHQNAQPHLKWNGTNNNSNKNSPTSSSSTTGSGAGGIQIYQIHQDSGVIENSSIYSSSQVSHSPSHLNGPSQLHNNNTNNSHLDHHQSPTSILHLSHHHHQQQQLSPQNHLQTHQHHHHQHHQQHQQQQQQLHHHLQPQHQQQQPQQQHPQHFQHQLQQQQHHQQPLQHPSSQQSIGSSCEVWSPAYSQYQYFTYHHAPQHASTQSSLVDTTNQSHCLSRNNGYMEHHHHHPQHGTISPISQLSHTHQTRTSITRTGVLCCPSLR